MTQRWRGAPVPAGPGRHMAVPGRPTEVECSVECRMLGLQQSRRLHHAQRVVNERVRAPTHYQQHSGWATIASATESPRS